MAQARAPKRKATSEQIQRKRRRVENFDPEPETINFGLPQRFRTAMHGNEEVRFLLHDDFDEEEGDDVQNTERLIVFSSDTMLNLLQDADIPSFLRGVSYNLS